MSYDHLSLDDLIALFTKTILRFSTRRYDLILDEVLADISTAIVARRDVAATALRSLLHDPREEVQLQAAIVLTELDPIGAAPTLERLEREAVDPVVGGTAQLKLMNNRKRGLIPAR